MARPREVRWIRAALFLQLAGYITDAVWHGMLHPPIDPRDVSAMTRHLLTVHLPVYGGALGVLLAAGVALARRLRYSTPGVALPVAFAGALVSAGAEGWHAYAHLRLDAHGGPVAGTMSFLGFMVVVVATWALGRGRRGDRQSRTRRAA
jgi:hypothetical protein